MVFTTHDDTPRLLQFLSSRSDHSGRIGFEVRHTERLWADDIAALVKLQVDSAIIKESLASKLGGVLWLVIAFMALATPAVAAAPGMRMRLCMLKP